VTHGAPSGHCGRGAPGVDLVLLRLSFLDSVGMRAPLVNRWLLRCRAPPISACGTVSWSLCRVYSAIGWAEG